MYILTDSTRAAAIAGHAGIEVVHRYPELLLLKTPLPPAGLAPADYEVLDAEQIMVHGVPVEIREGQFDLSEAPHTLLRFAGPVAPEWRAALEAGGVKVLFWCPRFGACVGLPAGMDAAALTQSFPFIVGARPYLQEQCSRGLPDQRPSVRQRAGMPGSLFDLVCFSRADRVRVEDELRGRGIPILASSSSKIRVKFDGDPALLRDLVGVKLVGPARGVLTLASATTQSVLGMDSTDGRWQTSYSGSGQIVAVADTGLDSGAKDGGLHPDFQGRVRHISSWPINPSWSSFVKQPGANDNAADLNTGHGTHVAGLAVGSGALSGGLHRGVAPEAELVFQALEQYTEIKPEHSSQVKSDYFLSGRPLDLRQLYQEARDLGARLHINAWGDPAQGHYTDDSYETDLFLSEHPDAVILFAAGNDGSDHDGNGVPDPRTLYAPATAKNVVAVGATSGASFGVGMRGTWGDFDPQQQRFRNSARRVPVSGEPDRMALCSSAGPTADGRIKPDVCAPGTNLAGPRSRVTRQTGWGYASPTPFYMYSGGTSMATGVAGGFAAVLRQAWQEHRGGDAPSGVALKALMILGAKALLNRSNNREESRTVAGFGRLYFPNSLPSQGERSVTLFDETEPGLLTGEARSYPLRVGSAGAFRAVLAWYDAPGETLVNDLDLCLIDEQGQKVWGNHRAGEAGAPDRLNNVEVIDLPRLRPGGYELRVAAANVPAGPQPFALAVSAPGLSLGPTAVLLDVEVGALRGVGRVSAERLAACGLTRVGALVGLSEEQLGETLGVGAPLLTRLRARLILLEQVTAQARPVGLPPETSLTDLHRVVPQGTISQKQWEQARAALLPLTLAFKSQFHSQVTLKLLFG